MPAIKAWLIARFLLLNHELDIFSQRTSGPFRVTEGEIFPHSYRGGLFGYFITGYIPFLWTFYFAFYVYSTRKIVGWPSFGLLVSFTTLALVLIIISGLRLEITSQGIRYFAPFRGETFVTFQEISAVTLIDYRLSYLRDFLRYTLVIMPTINSKKTDLKIPLTFFSTDARTDLVRLLQPTSQRF
jgi:hypothetical protein